MLQESLLSLSCALCSLSIQEPSTVAGAADNSSTSTSPGETVILLGVVPTSDRSTWTTLVLREQLEAEPLKRDYYIIDLVLDEKGKPHESELWRGDYSDPGKHTVLPSRLVGWLERRLLLGGVSADGPAYPVLASLQDTDRGATIVTEYDGREMHCAMPRSNGEILMLGGGRLSRLSVEERQIIEEIQVPAFAAVSEEEGASIEISRDGSMALLSSPKSWATFSTSPLKQEHSEDWPDGWHVAARIAETSDGKSMLSTTRNGIGRSDLFGNLRLEKPYRAGIGRWAMGLGRPESYGFLVYNLRSGFAEYDMNLEMRYEVEYPSGVHGSDVAECFPIKEGVWVCFLVTGEVLTVTREKARRLGLLGTLGR